ncbi:substrate-binding domain-containing protein [Aeromicrobium sp. SMF47]|uniref:sugar ABC transporter substrate-binding protein n=1 Tax=Aeromicrobium TaxID=2040 RepID=UPI00129EBCB9|nr:MULTISPECIES: sugar ABC transporter substrate-binding protein [Aeromicrobium]MRJ75793.1 substrate-binding domain-containing protein [Aeromicrobium yanjiei]MRK00136.1 substrate-binding domain-containing protein [Aeromicrobium sp. S22]
MSRITTEMSRAPRALVAGALSALVLAGCGVGEKSSGNDDAASDPAQLEHAKAQVEKYKAEPTFDLDAPPVDVAALKGKTIFNIPNNSQVPFNIAQDKVMKDVAKRFGINFIQYENNGAATEWSSGIAQAISRKADVIILGNGTDPRLVAPKLREAKEAGVPVISVHNYTDTQEVPKALDGLLAGFTRGPFERGARLMADYIIAESEGKANILEIRSSDLSPDNPMTKAFNGEIKKYCPGCTTEHIDVPVTQWAQQITPQVQTALTANPKIDWIAPHYDFMGTLAATGVKQAGAKDRVKMASFNGNLAPLEMIQKKDVYVADVGEDIVWLGWAGMDLAFRVLSGLEPLPNNDPKTATRILDSSNIAEVGTPPEFGKGYGDAYVKGYEELWGVAK